MNTSAQLSFAGFDDAPFSSTRIWRIAGSPLNSVRWAASCSFSGGLYRHVTAFPAVCGDLAGVMQHVLAITHRGEFLYLTEGSDPVDAVRIPEPGASEDTWSALWKQIQDTYIRTRPVSNEIIRDIVRSIHRQTGDIKRTLGARLNDPRADMEDSAERARPLIAEMFRWHRRRLDLAVARHAFKSPRRRSLLVYHFLLTDPIDERAKLSALAAEPFWLSFALMHADGYRATLPTSGESFAQSFLQGVAERAPLRAIAEAHFNLPQESCRYLWQLGAWEASGGILTLIREFILPLPPSYRPQRWRELHEVLPVPLVLHDLEHEYFTPSVKARLPTHTVAKHRDRLFNSWKQYAKQQSKDSWRSFASVSAIHGWSQNIERWEKCQVGYWLRQRHSVHSPIKAALRFDDEQFATIHYHLCRMSVVKRLKFHAEWAEVLAQRENSFEAMRLIAPQLRDTYRSQPFDGDDFPLAEGIEDCVCPDGWSMCFLTATVDFEDIGCLANNCLAAEGIFAFRALTLQSVFFELISPTGEWSLVEVDIGEEPRIRQHLGKENAEASRDACAIAKKVFKQIKAVLTEARSASLAAERNRARHHIALLQKELDADITRAVTDQLFAEWRLLDSAPSPRGMSQEDSTTQSTLA